MIQIYNDINNVKIKNPIVSVGIFDGVHLGHQQIFRKLIDEAKANNGQSVVITFWPHPKLVLDPNHKNLSLINTIDEKIELIEKQGIEHFIIVPFTYEFSQLSSVEFINEYLHNKLNIKGLIVGYDHKFGKDRLGDYKLLKNYADKFGFILEKVNAYNIDNVSVSSTKIRNAILQGQIEKANIYLSRNFALRGHVTNGKQLGRNIGFPTANIAPDSPYKIIPANGVYAVKVFIQDKSYIGMLNIGIRPTVNNDSLHKSIEVHIIGFNEDVYGQTVKLHFHKRMRNEMKFNSIDDLKKQLELDKIQILNFFEQKS